MKQKLKALSYSILARKGGGSLPLFRSNPERREEVAKEGRRRGAGKRRMRIKRKARMEERKEGQSNLISGING